MERLDHLAAKFNHKCTIHEAWTEGKPELLQQDDYSDANLADVLVRNFIIQFFLNLKVIINSFFY